MKLLQELLEHQSKLKTKNSVRRSIAQDWITKKEIDDGLWDSFGAQYEPPEDDDYEEDSHPLENDGPAIGCGCWGCAENQPNQEAHMGPGGCLYVSQDSEIHSHVQEEEYYPSSSDDEPYWASRYEDRYDR
jgi:hypothetical protein